VSPPLVATYRLQLTPTFTFAEAAEVLPYLAALGVSHVYLSPIFEARPGSSHGYDVVDHAAIRGELGGEAGFEALRQRCVQAGMALVLDFVPNHAAVGPHNEAWQEVLAYGAASPLAKRFDLQEGGAARILLPFLGRYYGDALDAGELRFVLFDGHPAAAYYEHRFRLRPSSIAGLVARHFANLGDHPDRGSWARLVEEYEGLDERDRDRTEQLRERLVALADEGFDATLAAMAADDVHEILEQQRYRLAYWKTAGAEVNYRRFFDINDLAALRVEDPEVFDEVHVKLRELLTRPGVEGVRVDHVDGLYDPASYLRRLRELGPRYVWVEKILGAREDLPEGWAVDGATGYEVLNDITRALVWPGGARPLRRLATRYGGVGEDWDETAREGKRLVLRTALSGEAARAVDELHAMAKADYHTRDFTRPALEYALEEIVAALDRYRTYLPAEPATAEAAIGDAVARALAHNPADDASVYAFVQRALLGPLRPRLEARRQLWVGRLQQLMAPVAAKGVEDTAFYRDHRLVALNEVGGEPDRFALAARAFHARMRQRGRTTPRALNALATHDHKRGADVRARLALLSELHRPWAQLVRQLALLAARHRSPVGPTDADAYLFYQCYVALHGTDRPEVLVERLVDYARKASREAKQRTSWVRADETYERALERFVREMGEDEAVEAAVQPFASRLADLGFRNTLAQLVLQATVPGVPDVYQGTELLDLSLVDPDNRRPVGFDARRRILAEAPDEAALAGWLAAADPRLKLHVLERLLGLRQAEAGLFLEGDYRGVKAPVDTLAFIRRHGGRALMVVVPRFPSRPRRQARLSVTGLSGRFTDALSGRTVDLPGELELEGGPLPYRVLVGPQ
jgi:(1->4)-alpha-D-glucan 1-alpha-D-glucosylmutase